MIPCLRRCPGLMAAVYRQSCAAVSLNHSLSLSTTTSHKGQFKKSFVTSHGASNPLISGDDYSYNDGQVVPLGLKKKRRIIRQRELVADALRLLKELKFAEERHHIVTEEERQERDEVLRSKLKEKTSLALDPSAGTLAESMHREGEKRKQ